MSIIFTITQLSPLWEGLGPSFEQTGIPFTQGYFMQSLVEIGAVVLEKKMKMWKVYRWTDRQTDRQTDDGRQVSRKTHLSFQLRWAENVKLSFLNYIYKFMIVMENWIMSPVTTHFEKLRTLKKFFKVR